MESVRIDKWLWATRYFKSRSKSTAACSAGHVQVNDVVVKPSHKVVRGDMVRAITPRGPVELEVVDLHDKRVSARIAATLVVDHTPKAPPKPEPVAPRERGSGRPTKRDRRLIEKLIGD